tara:strand:+ start:22 stop:447 length:426 start_codon:yes stop_codon:yes gene_type:complete
MQKSIFIILLTLISLKSFGCSCDFPNPINDSVYINNDLIVKGQIKQVDTLEENLLIHVKILTNYKSTSTDSIIKILTPIGGSACGLNTKTNEIWLLFGYNYKESIHTNLCTRSQRLTNPKSIVYDKDILKGDLEFLEKNNK